MAGPVIYGRGPTQKTIITNVYIGLQIKCSRNFERKDTSYSSIPWLAGKRGRYDSIYILRNPDQLNHAGRGVGVEYFVDKLNGSSIDNCNIAKLVSARTAVA